MFTVLLAVGRRLQTPSSVVVLLLIPVGYFFYVGFETVNPILSGEIFRLACIIGIIACMAVLLPEASNTDVSCAVLASCLLALALSIVVDMVMPAYQVRLGYIWFSFPGTHPQNAWAGFLQPNNFASFTACVTATLFALKIYFDAKINRFFWVLVLLVGSALTSLANSKVGFIGLLLATCLICLVAVCGNFNRRNVWIGACAIVVGVTAVSIAGFQSGVDKTVGEITADSFSSSTQVRAGAYLFAIERWLEAPWFGHGYGQWLHLLQDAVVEGSHPNLTWLNGIVFNFAHSHSEPLQWLVEFGITGLALIVGPWMVWFLSVVRHLGARALSVSVLIPVILHACVEMPLQASGLHWLLLIWVPCLFTKDRRGRKSPCKHQQNQGIALWPIRSLLVVVSVAITTTFLWSAYDHARLSSYHINQSAFFSDWITAIEDDEWLFSSPLVRQKAEARFDQMAAKVFYENLDKERLVILLPSLERSLEASPNIVSYVSLIAAYQQLNDDRGDALRHRYRVLKGFNEKNPL